MKEAKKELGKAFLNLANMVLVVYLLGNYLNKNSVNYFILFLIIYGILSLYYIGFYLIKEGSNECNGD